MSFPLSPEAAAAVKELDFPIVDSHHHIWGDVTTPRAQSLFAALKPEEFGYPPLQIKKKIPPGFEVKPSPLPAEGNRKFLSGLVASFGNIDCMMQDYNPEDLRRDIAEAAPVVVESTVHLECGWTVGTKDGETEYIQKIADATGNQIGAAIVGTADLLEEDTAKVEALLRAHMKSPNFRGIRQSITFDPTDVQMPHAPIPDITRDPRWVKNFELFRKLDLEFDAWCYGDQIPLVTELAKKFPEVRIVLNHFGTPLGIANDDAMFAKWKTDIKALADASPNVYAKLSGLMPMLGFDWGVYKGTWPNAGPTAKEIAGSRFGDMVRWTIEVFGTDRCFYGSNFPVDAGMARYGELLASYVIVAKEMGLGKEDLKKLFRDNARKFYRIK
ncbi:hypothetical protein DFJ74DRAFT_771581 [Hyaloraphidium curvatum]|nr:hypothetical protein DFJ74DRAFT_771581 [Hyaloraphidium curvatum]